MGAFHYQINQHESNDTVIDTMVNHMQTPIYEIGQPMINDQLKLQIASFNGSLFCLKDLKLVLWAIDRRLFVRLMYLSFHCPEGLV
jgi:hypothetical protein